MRTTLLAAAACTVLSSCGTTVRFTLGYKDIIFGAEVSPRPQTPVVPQK